MPGKVKVRILAARHLPVMDRSSENTDAFAEVKFGEVTHKTEVVRKSLNPQWNSEWFHFEAADDMKLQDEPLQIRVMDYDTYSANDAIGKVYIDLNPLLWPSVVVKHAGRSSQKAWSESTSSGIEHTPGGSLMSGWLPIYDTMHGIRGEVNVIVKIEFFSDFNQFRQSSCGVQFFYSPCVPEGYRVQAINGFVEELVVNDDPEYQWIDKIRTPRASNEARQTLFMKLSGTIQRKIGLKALELGGNVVVGYQQKFDIEGDTGIAVRGIGTAMSLVRDDPIPALPVMNGSGSNKGLSENRESVEPPSCHYFHSNDNLNFPPPIMGLDPDSKPIGRSGIDATMSEFCFLSASPPKYEPFHHVKSSKPFGIGAFVTEVATKFDNSQQRIVHLRSVSSTGMISPVWSSSPTHLHRSSLRQGYQQRKVSSMKARFSSTAELISPNRHTKTTTPSSFQGSSASLNSLHFRDRSLSRIFKAFKGFARGPKYSSSSSLNPTSVVSLEETVLEEPENLWCVQDLVDEKPKSKQEDPLDHEVDDNGSERTLRKNFASNRQDSTISSNTSEVTLINTIVNKGLTSEGDLVRMQLSQCHTVQWSPVAPVVGVPVAQAHPLPPFNVDPATPTPVEYIDSPLTKTCWGIPDSISNSSSSSVDSSSSCSFSKLDPNSNSICFFEPASKKALLPIYALPKPSNMNVDSFHACAPASPFAPAVRKPMHRSLLSILSSSPKSHRKSIANNQNNMTSSRPRFGSDPNMRVQTRSAHSSPQTKSLFLNPIPSRAQMERQVSPKFGNSSSGNFDTTEQHDTGNNDTVSHHKISMDGSTRSMENGSKSIMIAGGSSTNLEQLSISPKGPTCSDRMGTKLNLASTKSGIQLENQHDLLEYPFITLQKFPPSFINKIGGFVSCRSVKILDGVEDDGEIRENWWSEIRQEIRSHARCLGCNMVVGYSEDTVIWDDVVVLCASGTAASGNLHYMLDLDTNGGIFGPGFLNKNDVNLGKTPSLIGNGADEAPSSSSSNVPSLGHSVSVGGGGSCSYAHIPYLEYTLPFTAKCGRCQCCGKGRVPDVLFTTIEPPSHFDITGRGCLIQAKVLRMKKDLKGESNAKEISDALPFIEYEIHRQLINKLKVKGMNALFGLKLKVSMGDRTIIGTATATACYMTALPTPSKPKLVCSSAFPNDPNYLQRCQKRLNLKIAENEKYYGLNPIKRIPSTQSNISDPVEHDQEDGPETEFTSGNKDTCVLEIDDSEDADILDSLMDPYPPPYVQVFSTEELVGISKGLYVETCQTFSQVWRGRIHPSSRDLSSACQRLLAAIYFKLRRLRPCIVSHVSFQADLDEENELQLCIYGTAIGLGHDGKTRAEIEAALRQPGDDQKDLWSTGQTGQQQNSNIGSNGTMTLDLECNQGSLDGASDSSTSSPSHSMDSQVGRGEMRMPKSQTGVVSIPKFFTSETHQALFPGSILLTPSSFVPGARIDKYLGNLNFFIIRESSSLREAGGLNQFIQSFLSEVNAIVRSHVHALGGNALVAFFMLEFVVEHSTHKNQGQCLVHVGGDVVSVTYMK